MSCMNCGKRALLRTSALSSYHTDHTHWACALRKAELSMFVRFGLGLTLAYGLSGKSVPSGLTGPWWVIGLVGTFAAQAGHGRVNICISQNLLILTVS